MAGIFWKQVPIFNRAPVPLYVVFDGERHTIPTGLSTLPEQTIYHAKNQNPIMGSQDPYHPGVFGARLLIVTEGEDGWNQPLTKEEWEAHCNRPCREDEQIWFKERYGEDPHAKLVSRGLRNSVAARNRSEASSSLPRSTDFTAREA